MHVIDDRLAQLANVYCIVGPLHSAMRGKRKASPKNLLTRFLFGSHFLMDCRMHLRSHTARKHFPPLPDEIWTIVLDVLGSTSVPMWKKRCRLARTAKCFALTMDTRLPIKNVLVDIHIEQGPGLYWTEMTPSILSSFVPCTQSISCFHHFLTIECLDLSCCVLTYGDQLSLSLTSWPVLRACNFDKCG
jgi:hypothetical protein